MSATPGPNIVTNGLVLEIDPANTAKLALGSISTNFIQNGYFANGQGSPQNCIPCNNPTNAFIVLSNPGETEYVLRQNGTNAEYELQLTTQLLPGTTYVMSGWYAKSSDYNGTDTMFHALATSSSGANVSTPLDIGTTIFTKTVGGITWSYGYRTITTPADYNNAFYWYVGYGATNTTGFRYYTNLKVERGTFPTLPDLSGNNNNARPENGITYSSSNQGALVFDGTNDYSISPNSFISGNSPFTVCGFFRRTASTSQKASWGVGGGSSLNGFNSYSLGVGELISLDLWGDTTFQAPVINDLNQWNFTAWVYRGTVFNRNNTSIYKNSTEYTGTNLSIGRGTETSIPNISTTGTVIGRADTVSNDYYGPFNIGNILFYNRALTSTEIAQNFNALRGRYGI